MLELILAIVALLLAIYSWWLHGRVRKWGMKTDEWMESTVEWLTKHAIDHGGAGDPVPQPGCKFGEPCE